MSNEEHVTDLSEAARRAGYIVTEQIDTILDRAQREAATIRRDAERDAEDIRREAITAAERLLGRLHALEFPLGQLVADLRDETERVSRQLEDGGQVDGQAMPLPPPSTPTGPAESPAIRAEDHDPVPDASHQAPGEAAPYEDAPSAADESPSAAQESLARGDGDGERAAETAPGASAQRPEFESFAPQTEAAEQDLSPNQRAIHAEPVEPPAHVEQEDEAGKAKRRLKRAKGLFITAEGSCAICQRTFKAGSAAELDASGWKVSGDVGLCPDCQADRWQLPEGARLPFRRGVA